MSMATDFDRQITNLKAEQQAIRRAISSREQRRRAFDRDIANAGSLPDGERVRRALVDQQRALNREIQRFKADVRSLDRQLDEVRQRQRRAR
jgi:prefoldin subunit 5